MVPAPRLIGILTGPTATGKTSLALELASRSRSRIEIINADSLLVYRGMDVGTAKPSGDERGLVPHHLIDIADPGEAFTAGEFHRAATKAIGEIEARGHRALIVGGTGFYLKTLLYGLWQAPKADPVLRAQLERETNEELHSRLKRLDPASALRIGAGDRYRLVRALELIELGGKTPSELQALEPKEPDPRFALWVLDRSNEELHGRIRARTAEMLEKGLIEETRRLRERYAGQPLPRSLSSVGYAQVGAYLDETAPPGRKIRPGPGGLRDEIELATRQLVKKQRTWFRGQKASIWFTLDRDLAAFRARWAEIYEI